MSTLSLPPNLPIFSYQDGCAARDRLLAVAGEPALEDFFLLSISALRFIRGFASASPPTSEEQAQIEVLVRLLRETATTLRGTTLGLAGWTAAHHWLVESRADPTETAVLFDSLGLRFAALGDIATLLCRTAANPAGAADDGGLRRCLSLLIGTLGGKAADAPALYSGTAMVLVRMMMRTRQDLWDGTLVNGIQEVTEGRVLLPRQVVAPPSHPAPQPESWAQPALAQSWHAGDTVWGDALPQGHRVPQPAKMITLAPLRSQIDDDDDEAGEESGSRVGNLLGMAVSFALGCHFAKTRH